MERIVLTVLVFITSAGLAAKHVFVSEHLSWSDAQEYCRSYYTDLSPITNDLEGRVLLSQTENLLAQNQIQNSTITQRVWVGLRFLGDTWMWANGDPLEFRNWNQTCPVWKRCGALTKQGEWENRDYEAPSSKSAARLEKI
uniref:C-type lectin domain-containing protein n=1 Tax=Oryzias melastigma TaxID=30732 RepID=A0A3B3BUN7_ORYME